MEPRLSFKVEFGLVAPILRLTVAEHSVALTTDKDLLACIGKAIVEVLASEMWPGLGLLIEGNTVIWKYAFQHGGGWLVGPTVTQLCDPRNFFGPDDVVPYWDQAACN
jgi:hypothetical protein